MLRGLVDDHPDGSFSYLRGMLTGSSHGSHPLSEWALRPTRYASVWPTDKLDPKKWGGTLENDRTYCVGLVTRVDQIINAPEMECVMRPGTKRTVATVLQEFVGDNSMRVL